MEQSSIKSLVRLVLGAQDYSEFELHLTTRGVTSDGVRALWEHYRFMHDSSYLSPWVRACLLDGEKLDTAARNSGFTLSKVRTDVYRSSQAYSAFFPFDIFDLAFSDGITKEVLEDNDKVLKRLWKKFKPTTQTGDISSAFAINIFDYIDRPEKHELSDEDFDELRAMLSRLSKDHLKSLLELSDPRSLQYGLYLLTNNSLEGSDSKRSSLLKSSVGLV
jgi:hypothetical protein